MNRVELRTLDVPKAERFDWWCDLVRNDLAPTDIASEHQYDFRASAARLELGPVAVAALAFPTLQSWRTPRLIRQSDPELWELAYVAGGVMGIEQERSRAQVRGGDLLLYDTSRPFDSRVTEGGRVIILHLPRSAVPLPTRTMRDLLSRRLPAQRSGALLTGFLERLADHQWGGPEAERLGSAAVDLALAFLGGLADQEGLLAPETRQNALLHRVKAFISANLSDRKLTPQTVAEAHYISVRCLHHLFRGEEQTVSAFIRALRLERCRADLAKPSLASHPVGAVGARWGFANAEVFSRAFKAAYGTPPGEYRRRCAERGMRHVTASVLPAAGFPPLSSPPGPSTR
ncbi:helix-turn-helix domain-containing protein [Kitasatospora aureofaciens]|uniref:AraC-like ligand-binding domain-containing protein n=1 Tax=Kitasatospora aureofaciens TaxID=1894 RepID=UPI0033DA4B95